MHHATIGLKPLQGLKRLRQFTCNGAAASCDDRAETLTGIETDRVALQGRSLQLGDDRAETLTGIETSNRTRTCT